MSEQTVPPPVQQPVPELESPKHLKSYPLVNDAYKFAVSRAYVATAVSYVKPIVVYVQSLLFSVALVKSLLVLFDSYFNKYILDSVDKLVPPIKTVGFDQLNARAAQTYSKIDPVPVVKDLVNNQIKPSVTATVDPIIKPFNNRFETLINNYLPEDSGARATHTAGSSQAPSSELPRLYNLTSSAINKTVPIANQELANIQSHITSKYNSNLTQPATIPTKIHAAAKTSVDLSNEGLDILNKTFENTVKPKLSETYETNIKPKVAPYFKNISVTIEKTKNTVDGLISEAAETAGAITSDIVAPDAEPIEVPAI